eukprot:TRINITY_DN2682_c0_g1_i5.p2 TRINITY_DN2682_c0_g1~~TRINITY_DN2682_c0_g1_i5.p2  ORF type:complete len:139 (-),score=33.21 TRINITY_DN2682_c0_g1_i5:448-864(-)
MCIRDSINAEYMGKQVMSEEFTKSEETFLFYIEQILTKCQQSYSQTQDRMEMAALEGKNDLEEAQSALSLMESAAQNLGAEVRTELQPRVRKYKSELEIAKKKFARLQEKIMQQRATQIGIFAPAFYFWFYSIGKSTP